LLGAAFPTGHVHTELSLIIPLIFGPVWLGVACAKGQLPITKAITSAPIKIESLKLFIVGLLRSYRVGLLQSYHRPTMAERNRGLSSSHYRHFFRRTYTSSIDTRH
jgi:hypothetical protein